MSTANRAEAAQPDRDLDVIAFRLALGHNELPEARIAALELMADSLAVVPASRLPGALDDIVRESIETTAARHGIRIIDRTWMLDAAVSAIRDAERPSAQSHRSARAPRRHQRARHVARAANRGGDSGDPDPEPSDDIAARLAGGAS